MIPEKPKTIYSINEGNSRYWDHPTSAFVSKVKSLTKPCSLRCVGSMVSDVHRTLLYGGIFMYPADSKSKRGKLRLLYEANPMAYICEQAGGYAVANGGRRILDITPTENDTLSRRTRALYVPHNVSPQFKLFVMFVVKPTRLTVHPARFEATSVFTFDVTWFTVRTVPKMHPERFPYGSSLEKQ